MWSPEMVPRGVRVDSVVKVVDNLCSEVKVMDEEEDGALR